MMTSYIREFEKKVYVIPNKDLNEKFDYIINKIKHSQTDCHFCELGRAYRIKLDIEFKEYEV